MKIDPAQGVLIQIADIIADYLNGKSMVLSEHSFFATELKDIGDADRCNLLKGYTCNLILYLLCGVVDQVRSLEKILGSGDGSITPYILMRTILEYAYKLTYVSEYHIGGEERTRRILGLLYTEILDYEKLPEDLGAQGEFVTEKALIKEWHKEMTGKDIRRVSAQTIVDAVWHSDSGYPEWDRQEIDRENVAYERGYRIGSAMAHGYSWAIGHYGLRRVSDNNRIIESMELTDRARGNFRLIAGGSLQYSFGFTTQFMHGMLAAPIMNRLGKLIARIEEIQPSA